MVKYMSKDYGIVTNFNKVTGNIKTLNDKDIIFHVKDLVEKGDLNMINKSVEFDVEKLFNGNEVARNIKQLKKIVNR